MGTVLMFDIFWMAQTTFRPMSYFVFYPVLLICAFFLSLPSVFSKNGLIQTVWLLIFDIWFIANLMYCRTYYNAIPLHSYGLVGNLSDFQASVWDSFKWYFIFLPLSTLGAYLFYSFSNKIKRTLPSVYPYFFSIIILAIVVWIADIPNGGSLKRMDQMSEYAYLSSSIPPMYSLAGYLVHDYYKSSASLSSEDKDAVASWIDMHSQKEKRYLEDMARTQRSVPRNLVIVLCESLESWPIGAKIEGKEITPNLNEWISDSTSFYAPNVVTQVGSGRSIEGQLQVTTGLIPMYNKVYAYDAADNTYFSLPKALKERGGKTILFTPDKPYVWNQARVAKAFGYDKTEYQEDFVIDETTGRTKRLSDGSLMRQIVEKIEYDSLWIPGERVMIMTVTNSGHNPFDLPRHLRTINFEGEYPKIIKDYMITAHYTDASLKTLIDYLKSRTDWDDTMVVITGDHEGLATDRRDALTNPASAEFVDPHQHTPLIILNSPVSGRYEGEMGQVDIYSTIIDLLQLDDYEWRGMGSSVFDPNFPGIAVGTAGDLNGVPSKDLSNEEIESLKNAKKISDLILKFNLLKHYPDSISDKP